MHTRQRMERGPERCPGKKIPTFGQSTRKMEGRENITLDPRRRLDKSASTAGKENRRGNKHIRKISRKITQKDDSNKNPKGGSSHKRKVPKE